MTDKTILVPQKGMDRMYELVIIRLQHTEFKWLNKREVADRMLLVNLAYWVAKNAHKFQKRDTGEKYFHDHIVDVAEIYLNELGGDSLEWVITAIFHDWPEDDEENAQEEVLTAIKVVSWKQIATNVSYLTKPHISTYLSPELRQQYESLASKQEKEVFLKPYKDELKVIMIEKYFDALGKKANDTTVLIKAADRIHNLRSLPSDPARIKKYIIETEQYILPILKKRNLSVAVTLIKRELIRLKLHLQTLETKETVSQTLSQK